MPSEIRAPRGSELTCKGWQQEAALRMLMNSLDDQVSERSLDLVVCGGGKAVRNWDCYHAIVRALRELNQDETLVVQSGKPVGIFRTHAWAPRVLMVNGNLVGRWSTQEQFQELNHAGLTLYDQMAAGSWTYIGAQSALQIAYEIFSAAAKKHFGGSLAGKLVVSGGMGETGGVQPLAAAWNGAVFLGIEVDAELIKKRIRMGYCDYCVNDLNEALRILKNAVRQKQTISVGLTGNCAEVIPELARRGVVPDLLTDHTGASDPLNGYIPAGLSVQQAAELRAANPDEYLKRTYESIARHVTGILDLQKLGATVFDGGNNIRTIAFEHGGVKDAYNFSGFAPTYLRPLLCQGSGPFRWVALSGDPADIHCIDHLALEIFPENEALCRWIRLAREHIKFQGLPARACWLGCGERVRLGARLNEMVARGELKAPIVMGRDHLDCGAAAPYRETEHMKDGSDAVADWPLLNALLNTASGASWVSIHSSGGVAAGNSLYAGQVIVADGTPETGERIERVLMNDPAFGITRYADADYESAVETAYKYAIKLPMLEKQRRDTPG